MRVGESSEALPLATLQFMLNKILTALNARLKVTNLYGPATSTDTPVDTLDGLPLGTSDGTATGEICVKVKSVGAGGIASSVAIDQTTPGTTNGVQLTGSQLTPVSVIVSGSGASPVAAGKKVVEFQPDSSFTGTLNGVAYVGTVDAFQSFVAPPGYTLAAIPYTVTAGTLRIVSY